MALLQSSEWLRVGWGLCGAYGGLSGRGFAGLTAGKELIFLNHLISIHFIGISYLRFTQCLYYMEFVHIYEWIWLLSWPISLVNSFILFNESFICLFF